MEGRAEFLRQRERLAARAATGIDDDPKLLCRKTAQDQQGMGVVARAELFRTIEQQSERVVGIHVLVVGLSLNAKLNSIWC
jgi:hypothetical protein